MRKKKEEVDHDTKPHALRFIVRSSSPHEDYKNRPQ